MNEATEQGSIRFYFSFRSPYAWIAAERLDSEWGELQLIKPLITGDQHLAVLCEALGECTSMLEAACGVRAIRHHFGHDNVLESLTQSEKTTEVHG